MADRGLRWYQCPAKYDLYRKVATTLEKVQGYVYVGHVNCMPIMLDNGRVERDREVSSFSTKADWGSNYASPWEAQDKRVDHREIASISLRALLYQGLAGGALGRHV
jgi:hypothetical protein